MIEGQVAIVTGASRGLGRHVGRRLAQEKLRVVLAGRSEHDLRSVAGEIAAMGGEAIAVTADVSRWPDVERIVDAAVARFGTVDIVINNAGVGWYKPFDEWTIEEIDLAIDVNLKGTIYMTKAVLPLMINNGGGQIVNIASDLGRRVLPNMAAYVASKYGVLGFAGSILREVRSKGVKITTLTPGIIDTFFGGGSEGTRDASWSLDPEFVAGIVADVLKLPKQWVIDELAVHAMGQDF
jgi:short-subunit dehydrogenase